MSRRAAAPKSRPTRSIRFRPGRIELSLTIDVDHEPHPERAVIASLSRAGDSIIEMLEHNRRVEMDQLAAKSRRP